MQKRVLLQGGTLKPRRKSGNDRIATLLVPLESSRFKEYNPKRIFDIIGNSMICNQLKFDHFGNFEVALVKLPSTNDTNYDVANNTERCVTKAKH